MVKITFLGTCSGTEPMPGMHHCSLVFEIGGLYYWFDAGENCSHAAYTNGIDLTKVRTIAISHMHIDHIGGLANLIFAINKITTMHKIPHINNNEYDIFLPDVAHFDAVQSLAFGSRDTSNLPVKYNTHKTEDGFVYEDENIRISAVHNTHLREDGSRGWHSYSYLIEAEGKRIVFSGDVGAPAEIDSLIGDGVDLVIMETGHHKVSSVLEFLRERPIKKLVFNHHGREIIGNRGAAQSLIDESGLNAEILTDMRVIEL